MYRIENAIAVEDRNLNGQKSETGVFDIVLRTRREVSREQARKNTSSILLPVLKKTNTERS